MSMPSIPRVLPPVLRAYLDAKEAYETARVVAITTFVLEVEAWIRTEALTAPQILARLSAVPVPEEMRQVILDLATR
jgi:purine nucleoside permease